MLLSGHNPTVGSGGRLIRLTGRQTFEDAAMVTPPTCESRSVHVYTIELDRITSREVLHAELAGAFSFPDHYGRNWDAFDEYVDDIELPAVIEVLGFQDFRFRLPREAKLLAHCLRAAAERRPPSHFKVNGLP